MLRQPGHIMRDEKFQRDTKLVLLKFFEQTYPGQNRSKSNSSDWVAHAGTGNIASTQVVKGKFQKQIKTCSRNLANQSTSESHSLDLVADCVECDNNATTPEEENRFQDERKPFSLHFYSDLETDSIASSNVTTPEDEERFQEEIQHTIKLQLENKDLKPVLSPITETAISLRKIADEFQADYERRIDKSSHQFSSGRLTYDNFCRGVNNIWESTPEGADWKMISTVMSFSGRCAHHLCNRGIKYMNQILDFTTIYLEDVAADFIINNGGWENISKQV